MAATLIKTKTDFITFYQPFCFRRITINQYPNEHGKSYHRTHGLLEEGYVLLVCA